jgi:hypothetical protein
MKTLMGSFVVLLSVSAPSLWADYGITSGFLEALMLKDQPHTEQPPLVDEKNIFEHAEVAPVLKSQAEILEGEQSDLAGVMSNAASKSLESANIPSSDARVELQKAEAEEDLAKYGPVSGRGPNEDESLNKADLDLKLRNSNPSAARIVRRAEPANGL